MRFVLIITATLFLTFGAASAAPPPAPAPAHGRTFPLRLPGNSRLSASSFLPKAEIESYVKTSPDVTVRSITLKRYSQFESDHNIGVRNFEVALDRMVWEAVITHANSFTNHAGEWAPGARVTLAFDAQTGQLIGVLTEGQRTKNFRPIHNP